MIKLRITITALILVALTDCSVNRVNLSGSKEGDVVGFSKSISFDKYGFPVVEHVLAGKPDRTGEKYIISVKRDNRIQSYHHVIIREDESHPDFKRPFLVVYEWTGRGFKVGYEQSKGIVEAFVGAGSAAASSPLKDDSGGCSAILAAPGVAAGTAVFLTSGIGGFIVGVANVIPATFKEFKKLGIKSHEFIISSTALKYDSHYRLKEITAYSPPPELKELAKTTYYYRRGKKTPYKFISHSIPEKKKRSVYFRK